jgi:hypothetical protein
MTTAAQLRKIVLALPEVEEKSHFGKPDFRVKNKIFAGLSADEKQATLKLPTKVQVPLVKKRPETFSFAAGAWGRSGWTYVELGRIEREELRAPAVEAWRLIAPKKLVQAFDGKAER